MCFIYMLSQNSAPPSPKQPNKKNIMSRLYNVAEIQNTGNGNFQWIMANGMFDDVHLSHSLSLSFFSFHRLICILKYMLSLSGRLKICVHDKPKSRIKMKPKQRQHYAMGGYAISA